MLTASARGCSPCGISRYARSLELSMVVGCSMLQSPSSACICDFVGNCLSEFCSNDIKPCLNYLR